MNPTIQNEISLVIGYIEKGKFYDAEKILINLQSPYQNDIELLHLLVFVLLNQKKIIQAINILEKIININPKDNVAKFNLAKAYFENNNIETAQQLYEELRKNEPSNIEVMLGLVDCLNAKNERENVKKLLELILSKEKHNIRAITLYFRTLNDQNEYEKICEISKDLHLQNLDNFGLNELAYAQRKTNRLTASIQTYKSSLDKNQNQVEIWINYASALAESRNFEEALAAANQSLKFKNDPRALLYKSNALAKLGEIKASMECLEEAMKISDINIFKDEYVEGDLLDKEGRHREAAESYLRGLKKNPEAVYLYGEYIRAKTLICDWTNYELHTMEIKQRIEDNKRTINPLSFLAISGSGEFQKKVAKEWVEYVSDENKQNKISYPINKKIKDKIVLGYFSPDFYKHAVSILTAELYELHDRNKFEVIAFSYSECPEDGMRYRLKNSFDKFIDVKQQSDYEIAKLARQYSVDVAIDLAGHTYASRTGIFSNRAAPVQISYLGFPGTQGANYIDYIIADPYLIPEENQKFYTEKIIYLPFYMVNDSKRKISDNIFSRYEMNLPENGFIYCCFNSCYKFSPEIFDAWMTVLNSVDNSVLWLLKENDDVESNLRLRAEQNGINSERLVFAGRISTEDYLARYRTADLFLDTFPFNAGTTASDALWADLPVLTLSGEVFASRMAGSILNSIGLKDLITHSVDEYVKKAIFLGKNPEEIYKFKKYIKNHKNDIVFNSKQITANIEKGYIEAYTKFVSNQVTSNIEINY